MSGEMERSKKEQVARLVRLMQLVSTQVHAVPPDEWSELELTMTQWRTLVLLSRGPRRMSEIAAYLGSSLSSATSMIDRLVNKQLVERTHDPADRRIVSCRLTALGQEEVDQFWRLGRKKIERVAGILTAEELEAVVHTMEVLLAAMERQAANGSDERRASPL